MTGVPLIFFDMVDQTDNQHLPCLVFEEKFREKRGM